MDTTAVRGLLAASLVPDADNRRRAELQLKQVRAPPRWGLVLFIFFCLCFVQGPFWFAGGMRDTTIVSGENSLPFSRTGSSLFFTVDEISLRLAVLL